MKYDFNKITDVSRINSEKWQNAQERDLIPMWIADMDFETIPEIKTAIKKRAETGIFGYTNTPDSFYQSITGWFKKRHNWIIEKEWIVHTSGVINALHIALKAITERNDGVIIQSPIYHPFYRVIARCGLRTITNPLKIENGKYVPDFDDLENKLKTEKPKVFILCNPHNPIGKVFTKDELTGIGELCLKYKVTVISDEIHCDLVYKGFKHIPFATISEEFKNNSITCTAPSKTFNLAGLFTSNIIIPDADLRKKFTGFSDEIGAHPVNIFGSIACETGYRYGGEWLEQLLSYLYDNRNFAMNYIKTRISKITYIEPEGTYFLWIDFRKLDLTNDKLEDLLTKKAKVWFNQGYIFGQKEGSGFVRMNLACPRSILEDALKRIEQAINSI
jgi:cysteine-S-conjugate beta-lyase